MNLNNSWLITIKKGSNELTQVLEAENMDQAIEKVKASLRARLQGLSKTGNVTAQKCCVFKEVKTPLRFTIGSAFHCVVPKEKDTIYTMYEKAKSKSKDKSLKVTEIISF